LQCVYAPHDAEADDVIASCVSSARASHLQSLIFTMDKDLMQLVDDGDPAVSMVTPGAKMTTWNEQKVCQKFRIHRPSQLPEFLALAGDQSDGIPGVPLIGPVMASDLLAEFGDLEGVLHAVAEHEIRNKIKLRGLGPKRIKKLIEHSDHARAYRNIIRLRKDLQTPDLQLLQWQPSPPQIRDLMLSYGFPSLAKVMESDSEFPP